MTTINVSELHQSTVLYLYTIRDEMWMNPPYQRGSDIWSLSKKQLLLDSLINGFDIPKLYIHKLSPPHREGNAELTMAIIDGKQRLEAIFGFIDGEFTLSADIEFLENTDVKLGSYTYEQLGRQHPKIKAKLDATKLDAMGVDTQDIELIEEMFSRLNEAVPLTAAEKRNAFGAPLPESIREIASKRFFTQRLPFTNTRYRFFDLSCKLLLLRHSGVITDTKKVHLDNFVKEYKRKFEQDATSTQEAVSALTASVDEILAKLSKIFVNKDTLLSSVGMVVVYYCLFLFKPQAADKLTRSIVERFEQIRKDNRDLAKKEDESDPPSYALLEFDRLMQSPNDASSIRFRVELLEKYLLAGSPSILKKAIVLLADNQGADNS